MKTLLRSFVINVFALWAISQIISGIVLRKGFETLIITALVLGLINLFVRPLLNLLFLPINLVTLGTFRWVVNAIALYLVTILVQDFKIVSFYFPGFSSNGVVLPAIFLGTLWAFVLISLLISLISNFLYWLAK